MRFLEQLRKHCREIRGFSLAEILLVVVIISIIAGIAIPNFSNTYKSLQLRKTAEDFVYIMRYAQSRAVTKNRLLKLVFNSDNSQYWLVESLSANVFDSSVQEYGRFQGRLGRTFTIDNSLKVSDPAGDIFFYPDGNIDRIRLHICREEKCLTVSTREQRGYVRLFNEKIE